MLLEIVEEKTFTHTWGYKNTESDFIWLRLFKHLSEIIHNILVIFLKFDVSTQILIHVTTQTSTVLVLRSIDLFLSLCYLHCWINVTWHIVVCIQDITILVPKGGNSTTYVITFGLYLLKAINMMFLKGGVLFAFSLVWLVVFNEVVKRRVRDRLFIF